MSARGDSCFQHDVLFHRSDDELLDTIVPFISTGLARDENAVVCFAEHAATLLGNELGRDDPRVTYLPGRETYSSPTGALAAYQQLVAHRLLHGTPGVRLVADASCFIDAADVAEWGRYEAVVNQAVRAYPVWTTCTYDTTVMSPEALTAGRLTHPTVVAGRSRSANPDFMLPAEYLRRTTNVDPDPAQSRPPDLELHLGEIAELEDLRLQLEFLLLQRHLVDASADLVLATNEVVTNGLRYGRPPVLVRVWLDAGRPQRVVCTISDQGDGFDDPFAGYVFPGTPRNAPTHGMGLWLARRLCDRVDLFPDPPGFTVRLVMWLAPDVI